MSYNISAKRALLYDTNANKGYIPYVNNATSSKVGVVKPDGVTTSVDGNGAISAIGCWNISYESNVLTFTSL